MGTYQIQDPTEADPFIETLKTNNRVSWFAAQVERASTGQLHVQFTLGLRDPYRFSALKSMLLPGAHLEATRNVAAAVKYCQKETTRVAGPFLHGKVPVGNGQVRPKLSASEALALKPDQKLQ